MMTGSQKFLKKHVLDEGLCTGCGACVGICPYQVIYHDRTVQLHGCDLVKGRCYDYCPRTPCDVGAIRERYCAAGDLTPEIGAVKGYYFSRAADPGLRNIGQHGATVTAMLELALSEGLIDAAVVSSRDQLSLRKGVIVQNREAIRTQDRILAMAPKSLEFAAPEERESMLEAISTVREEKGKLEVLLEKLLQMERDEKEDMEGLPAE